MASEWGMPGSGAGLEFESRSFMWGGSFCGPASSYLDGLRSFPGRLRRQARDS